MRRLATLLRPTTGGELPINALKIQKHLLTDPLFSRSFAIVMWEMIAGEISNPFIGMAPIKFYQQTVQAGNRPRFPENVDAEYSNLINECWNSTPDERPSFSSIVERLEQMLLKLGASTELPPSFQGGYHHALSG